MERMLCAQCEAVTYSAAAVKLVERGERCTRCGGELRVVPIGTEPSGANGAATRRKLRVPRR